MARRDVRYVILCEDRLQEVFARTYLIERGINKRRIRVEPIVEGCGSAEQYVRENYAAQVKLHRSKASYQSVALIVLIDADNYTVSQRMEQLDKTLDEKRQPKERIAIFVPKRHVETWIRYASGQDADETSSYHQFEREESKCKPHVRKLANEICRSDLPDDALPSLKEACKEILRIFP